jgi:hypothetical protein
MRQHLSLSQDRYRNRLREQPAAKQDAE